MAKKYEVSAGDGVKGEYRADHATFEAAVMDAVTQGRMLGHAALRLEFTGLQACEVTAPSGDALFHVRLSSSPRRGPGRPSRASLAEEKGWRAAEGEFEWMAPPNRYLLPPGSEVPFMMFYGEDGETVVKAVDVQGPMAAMAKAGETGDLKEPVLQEVGVPDGATFVLYCLMSRGPKAKGPRTVKRLWLKKLG